MPQQNYDAFQDFVKAINVFAREYNAGIGDQRLRGTEMNWIDWDVIAACSLGFGCPAGISSRSASQFTVRPPDPPKISRRPNSQTDPETGQGTPNFMAWSN